MTIHLGPWKFDPQSGLPIRVLVSGGPGTGKSALLKVSKLSFLEHGIRIMDLDNAMEMVDWYRHFAPSRYPVQCISMQHGDGVGINFANLIVSPTIRQLLAELLIVDAKRESNRFFVDMARLVVISACEALHKLAPGKALLHDIIGVALRHEIHSELVRMAGLEDPYTSFGKNDSKRDTITTIASRMQTFKPFAAMDKNCGNGRISLPHTNGALVLEWSYKHAKALNAIYALLFEYCAIEWLSDQRNAPVAAFIDEFRFLEKMGFMVPMINQGRKFNVSLFLTMHSVLGVYERYGKDLGGELIASPEYKMFLANPCIETAKWASQCLGEVEVHEDIMNRDERWSASIKMRPNVIPEQLRHGLKKADFHNDAIFGYADFPEEIAPFKSKFRHAVMIDRRPQDRPLLPEEATEFKPFSREDLARLGITCTAALNDIFNGVKKEKKRKESEDDTTTTTTKQSSKEFVDGLLNGKRPRGRPRKNT